MTSRRSSGNPSLVRELAGGVGDWGLLIPLSIALVALNGLDATIVFAGVGATYVATALAFRVPVPVQPLKAFAAAAIALGLSAETLAAGALLMAAVMAVLAVTGLAAWLAARFPLVLVRGIQAAVALLLGKAAVELALDGNWAGMPAIDPAVSFGVAAAACLALLLASSTRIPASLLVLVGGAVIGVAVAGFPDVGFGPEAPALALPDASAFGVALTSLVITQIPLTFGNSIVATVDAEREYFGAAAHRVTARRLAGSIAGANAFAGMLGGLPVCHGAGGVTAHFKLGARTWRATALAGAVLIATSLAFGASLPDLMRLVPPGALAGMLMFVAVQHGLLAARLSSWSDRLVAASVGGVTLLVGNLAIGFGVGVVLLALRAAAARASGSTRLARV